MEKYFELDMVPEYMVSLDISEATATTAYPGASSSTGSLSYKSSATTRSGHDIFQVSGRGVISSITINVDNKRESYLVL